MKILSIVGARPEFVQAAPVSRALRKHHHELLVHTGQHYDYGMSQAFFDDLGIPVPDYNLEVGSGSHAGQTADILTRLEAVLVRERPDLVIVRGDTNSTLAGALAAVKLHIPVAHIEAGERSFDRCMPEEVNRLVADSVADLFFCASRTAVAQLAAEGVTTHVHLTGDVMLDACLHNLSIARVRSRILADLGVEEGSYALATVHRAANTDDPVRLAEIVAALNAAPQTVILPLHPRTRAAVQAQGLVFSGSVRAIEPVGYLDMLRLESGACRIVTDSGGVQREAYFLGVPCLTMRDETEWTETVSAGWNMLVGAEAERILEAWRSFSPPAERPPVFGHGDAAERIAAVLDQEPVAYGQAKRGKG